MYVVTRLHVPNGDLAEVWIASRRERGSKCMLTIVPCLFHSVKARIRNFHCEWHAKNFLILKNSFLRTLFSKFDFGCQFHVAFHASCGKFSTKLKMKGLLICCHEPEYFDCLMSENCFGRWRRIVSVNWGLAINPLSFAKTSTKWLLFTLHAFQLENVKCNPMVFCGIDRRVFHCAIDEHDAMPISQRSNAW